MLKIPATDIAPPWTRIFIELALRGLRRAHHDYLLFSIQQDWNRPHALQGLNNGAGVAFAEEPAVCAAIAQEFIYSRFVSGVSVEGIPTHRIEAGQRYYRLWREHQYAQSRERADFLVDRFDPTTEKRVGRPSAIEAKRAFRWATKLGDTSPSKPLNLREEIRDDINKLRTQAQESSNSFRGYILVWNITDISSGTKISPRNYFEDLDAGEIILWQTRVSPLSVVPRMELKSFEDMQVDKWLWVGLAEVTSLQSGDLNVS